MKWGLFVEELIIKAKAGDKEAFITAIDQCKSQLYKISKTILKTEDDIGDAIQETIMAAYKNLNILKSPEYFTTWTVRKLINKCNDIIKNNSKVIPLQEHIEIPYMEEKFLTVELNESIDALGENYKLVLCLYYFMGYNTREIGELLNEKEGTIKSKLSRARTKLKGIYSSIEEGLKYFFIL